MVTARSVLLSSSAEKKKNSSMRRRSDVPPPAANYFEGFTEDEVALIRRDMLKWLQDTGHTSVRALRNWLDQTRGTVAPPADIGTPPGVRQDRPAAEATPAGFGGPDLRHLWQPGPDKYVLRLPQWQENDPMSCLLQ